MWFWKEMVFDEACAHAYKLAEEHGYTFVHPFDDLDVAAGQGSIAMEIIKELPTVDYILVPIGAAAVHRSIYPCQDVKSKDQSNRR